MTIRQRPPGRRKTWKDREITRWEIIRRTLNKLPPFLDGYSAIVRAIENDDVAHAYFLAKELEHSSRIVKARIFALFSFVDRTEK